MLHNSTTCRSRDDSRACPSPRAGAVACAEGMTDAGAIVCRFRRADKRGPDASSCRCALDTEARDLPLLPHPPPERHPLAFTSPPSPPPLTPAPPMVPTSASMTTLATPSSSRPTAPRATTPACTRRTAPSPPSSPRVRPSGSATAATAPRPPRTRPARAT
eukprot:2924550-Prymnesium_polylepis.1